MATSDTCRTVTLHLARLNAGDNAAAEELFVLVYDELRALAAAQLRQERAGHTLQATALVHEVYLRLVNQQHAHWNDRVHFLAVAAHAIRRILIDHARRRNAAKRSGGAGVHTISLDAAVGEIAPAGVAGSASPAEARAAPGGGPGPAGASRELDDHTLLELHDSLDRLARLDPRQGRVVEMRFFGGMTLEEIAHVLGVSLGTVKNDWRFARAWLQRELERGGEGRESQRPANRPDFDRGNAP